MKQKGFTLIELLVVIAIIGILTFVMFINLSSGRVKARDGKRVSDMHQIQSGLEIYNSDCGRYPGSLTAAAADGCTDSTTLGDFIEIIPTDPQSGAAYPYTYESSDNTYTVTFSLESNLNNLGVGLHTLTKDGIQ